MKRIDKGNEPSSLTFYRSSIANEDMEKPYIYENYVEKTIEGCNANEMSNLRKQLLEEQGYICCYCMGRISCKNSKIEHFQAQTNFRSIQITYSNLFVACKGGEGTREQHCDTSKGNSPLNHIDLLREIENEIKYFKNGVLTSKITTENVMSSLTEEINTILNLNTEVLRKNRKQTYDDFIRNLKSKWTRSNLEKAIEFYKVKQNGKYLPYSGMMIYLLSKKVRSM